jgi:hypothetical protein
MATLLKPLKQRVLLSVLPANSLLQDGALSTGWFFNLFWAQALFKEFSFFEYCQDNLKSALQVG